MLILVVLLARINWHDVHTVPITICLSLLDVFLKLTHIQINTHHRKPRATYRYQRKSLQWAEGGTEEGSRGGPDPPGWPGWPRGQSAQFWGHLHLLWPLSPHSYNKEALQKKQTKKCPLSEEGIVGPLIFWVPSNPVVVLLVWWSCDLDQVP